MRLIHVNLIYTSFFFNLKKKVIKKMDKYTLGHLLNGCAAALIVYPHK